MFNTDIFYVKLTKSAKAGLPQNRRHCIRILTGRNIELLKLLDAAYTVRRTYFGNRVTVHILNNVQNGHCPEDCHYCAQSQSSKAKIETYPMKSDAEILAEAKAAHANGAFRYCMVFAGKKPSEERIRHLTGLIRKIKSLYPLEVCVSPGVITREQARTLKQAGLDRLNHNINTSRNLYRRICTSHTYEDRLQTLKNAHAVGLPVCSGVIIGMGETAEDIIDMALALREIKAESIPVNFFIPIPGLKLKNPGALTPEYCLRVLCLFRFLNPKAEIRIAAGREIHLRDMEVLALYPANSLFLDGYLNTKGEARLKTLTMIRDAGFALAGEHDLNGLIEKESGNKKITKSQIFL
ncbi:MAG: biotin synthase BioB [Candidatus Omnitrophica bacterium]|nr:biotin synthase BioB [Candidatus Omnitrophota bacterium]